MIAKLEAYWNIDNRLKPFIKVVLATSVSKYFEELFCEATRIIANVAKPQFLKVVFYREEFKIVTSEDQIAVYIKSMILYDLQKLEAIIDKRMTFAVILEELVHALLEIHNEVEASMKVCELYSEIKADPITGQYILANKS